MYICFNVLISAIHGNLKFPSIPIIIFYFLTASSYYHLWFFALIIQLYILYPYIIKLYENYENNGKIFHFIFFAFIIQQAWIIIENIVRIYFISSTYFNSITYFNTVINLLLDRIFFSNIFYFIIGIYVCQSYQSVLDKIFKAKNWIISIIVIFTFATSALWLNGIFKYGSFSNISPYYSLYYRLLNSIYYPFIFSILLIISSNLAHKNKYSNYSKIISFFGKCSFGIYLIHPLYMTIISSIFSYFNVDFNHFIFYPSLFISTLILSYFSVYLIFYLPYGEILIGIKNSKSFKNDF